MKFEFEVFYWSEIEEFSEADFFSYGVPIPNVIASELLNDKNIKLLDDGFHYKYDGDLITKVIYGFKNEEAFLMAMEKISSNYDNFEKQFNDIPKDELTINECVYYVKRIYSINEDGMLQIVPQWRETLVECLNILKERGNKSDEIISNAIDDGKYLLKHMIEFKINKI